MSISLVTWPSRSLSSKCFFRARLDDCYDPVIFLSLGVFSFGTMESRFVFLLSPFSRPIAYSYNIVFAVKNPCSAYIKFHCANCAQLPWVMTFRLPPPNAGPRDFAPRALLIHKHLCQPQFSQFPRNQHLFSFFELTIPLKK